MSLLPVLHLRQRNESDCLAACAAMVLEYLQLPYRYDRLLKILQIRSFGTSFRNIENLRQLGVTVENRYARSTSELEESIQLGLPPIVFLNTEPLAHWDFETGHAVVVIGIDEQHITIHDPAVVDSPLEIPIVAFEAAWIEQLQQYAIIRL